MEVVTPLDLEEALIKLQQDPQVEVLAGGTDLLVKWKNNLIDPQRAMNILKLTELKFIREEKGQLIIGPLMTHQELTEADLVRKNAPILAAACAQVGSLQIRNRGTLGGNLVTASPAGDTIPALVVANASLTLRSAQAERIVSIRDFFKGPGKTVLQPGELLTAITVPCRTSDETYFYRKLGQRQAMAISIVSVACKAKLVNQVIKDIQIACGSVGPTVLELTQTARNLTGCGLQDKKILALAANAGSETNPISDIRAAKEYRRDMVGALLYEGLQKLQGSQRV
ncbi:FAD binding domain-containing protein [Desulfotomaculum sp. 1211_IL3151]|uniref:FAD binding domain-containing protein n=1 Tax=Desulfotomaculum sp. 1211_IL3151 TaxID=3084055 RepID=UPI002FDA702C